MSAVPHKEVVIVTGTTVKAPERFKLRGSLIGYLPLYVLYIVVQVCESKYVNE